jgi:hypothetical protein
MSSLRFRRYHWHNSKKAGLVYLDSSYELKGALILDDDDEVVFYEVHQEFLAENNRKRIFDFLATYKSGRKKLIEIKPHRRVCQFLEQIEDNRKYALDNGYDFEVWSESHLGFNSETEATVWADQYLSLTTETDYTKIRKDRAVLRSTKYYRKHIANNKIAVFCNYCNEEHNVLRLNYDKNIAKNGRYICEKEGGHISGSKPKLHLIKENPHASEGKKQCNECQQVKLFEEFSPDKSKRDGYSTRCKPCRSAKYKTKYHQNKNNK